MPESDYMNERQLAFFRNGSNNSNRTSWPTPARPPSTCETQFVPDPADRATIEEEHALELRTRDRERKLLRRCNSPSPASTAANTAGVRKPANPSASPPAGPPTATLSLEAQERREMRQKLYGD